MQTDLCTTWKMDKQWIMENSCKVGDFRNWPLLPQVLVKGTQNELDGHTGCPIWVQSALLGTQYVTDSAACKEGKRNCCTEFTEKTLFHLSDYFKESTNLSHIYLPLRDFVKLNGALDAPLVSHGGYTGKILWFFMADSSCSSFLLILKEINTLATPKRMQDSARCWKLCNLAWWLLIKMKC